ncbi:YceI family protein [Lysobacter sp. N42]|uniref:YceI family protein n=1 Tax=Lysobacter sp. N42 TaxID=2545719 RepID=UPI0010479BF6|nr:YceI family protein [Lysobacter sp. N42]TCZ82020.1 polyisoprenoid-binding protein [Lysobacter sp. N42]
MRAAAGLLLATALAAPVAAQDFDTSRSRIEFDVRTRMGMLVRGQFPRHAGRVEALSDGRRRVHVRLSAADVVVAGPARYTALARGPQLFDAANHPWIEFVSDPYPAELARTGGALPGRLRLRGVERAERFVLAPAACARPGHDCPVVAQGRVSRDDYGLDGWRWALADRVRFRLHVLFAD